MAISYSASSPEDGCFWRALSPEEAAIFDDSSQTYGLGPGIKPNGLVELHSLRALSGKKCVRLFCNKTNAVGWARASGKGWVVLRVPSKNLVEGVDFEVWGATGDVVLEGAKAREFGTLHDPDSVP